MPIHRLLREGGDALHDAGHKAGREAGEHNAAAINHLIRGGWLALVGVVAGEGLTYEAKRELLSGLERLRAGDDAHGRSRLLHTAGALGHKAADAFDRPDQLNPLDAVGPSESSGSSSQPPEAK